MKVINLFGGPGIGKSTLASYLFYKLKSEGYNTELVSEYAKELTWEENFDKLSDQLYVTAKQNRRLHRLEDKVDVVVTDCPILLGINYATPEYIGGTFVPMVYSLFESYDNINIVLNRTKPYIAKGRTQSKDEAIKIDENIANILSPYKSLNCDGTGEGINELYPTILTEIKRTN